MPPTLWVHTPKKRSWDVFNDFLHTKHILVTPGAGYGACGEHFFRVSAFAHRSEVDEVVSRLQNRE